MEVSILSGVGLRLQSRLNQPVLQRSFKQINHRAGDRVGIVVENGTGDPGG
jgi:hypothetical protein